MTILFVQRLTWEEKLRHFAVDGTMDFEMNMRCAHIAAGGRIRAGLDGRDRVATVTVSPQRRIALKIRAAELHHLTGGSFAVTANQGQVDVRIAWLFLRVEWAGNQVGRLAASHPLSEKTGRRR